MPPEAIGGNALKELTKEPLVYVLAVMFAVGGYLVKDASGLSVYMGVGLICLGSFLFIVKFVASLMDSTFKHRYQELINSQASTIASQKAVIDAFSKNTIDAHRTIAAPSERFGSYIPQDETTTATGSINEAPRSWG